MGQWLSQTRRFNKFYTDGEMGGASLSDYGILDPMYKVNGGIIPHLYGINGSTYPNAATSGYKVQKTLTYSTSLKTLHYEYPNQYEIAFNLYHIGEYQTELIGTENVSGVTYALPTLDLYVIGIAYINLMYGTWANLEQYLPTDFQGIPIDKDIRNIVVTNSLFTLTSSEMATEISRGNITNCFSSNSGLMITELQGIYLFSELVADIMDKLSVKTRLNFETYSGSIRGNIQAPLGRSKCFWDNLSGARGQNTGSNRLDTTYYSDSFPEVSNFTSARTPSVITPLLTDPRDTSDFNDFITEYSTLYPSVSQNQAAIDSFLYTYSSHFSTIPTSLANYQCLKLKTLIQGLFTPVIPKLGMFYLGSSFSTYTTGSTVQNPTNGVYYTYMTIPKIKGVTLYTNE